MGIKSRIAFFFHILELASEETFDFDNGCVGSLTL